MLHAHAALIILYSVHILSVLVRCVDIANVNMGSITLSYYFVTINNYKFMFRAKLYCYGSLCDFHLFRRVPLSSTEQFVGFCYATFLLHFNLTVTFMLICSVQEPGIWRGCFNIFSHFFILTIT